MRELEEMLCQLYQELRSLDLMTDEEACRCWNTDSKDDIRQAIQEDIEEIENILENPEYDYTDDELEDERTALCHSQGLARYC